MNHPQGKFGGSSDEFWVEMGTVDGMAERGLACFNALAGRDPKQLKALEQAVDSYRSERVNPVPDYTMLKRTREAMFSTLAAFRQEAP